MTTFKVSVSWHLQPGEVFEPDNYHRDHDWTFSGGEVVPASASAGYGGSPSRVNPDEAVVAATAGCHMLTFLAIAAKQRLKVVSYIDHPEGTLEKNDEGRMAISHIRLNPRVVFDGEMSEEKLSRLHDSAHRNCFVANSLRSEVSIVPDIGPA